MWTTIIKKIRGTDEVSDFDATAPFIPALTAMTSTLESRACDSSMLPMHALASNDSDVSKHQVWEHALQAHRQQCKGPKLNDWTRQRGLPVPALHLAVAELLWNEREQMRSRLVHIQSAQGQLLAVVNRSTRQLQLRRSVSAAETQALSWRQMPVNASGVEGMAATQFEIASLDDLLWQLGQFEPRAAESLPTAVASAPLALRRLPLTNPAMLEMRHFALMHLLSREHLSFEQIIRELDDDDTGALCSDVTSLVLCRCLVPTLSKN